jgi:hypothetical protein
MVDNGMLSECLHGLYEGISVRLGDTCYQDQETKLDHQEVTW